MSKKSTKEIVAELVAKRDRTGKKPLSTAERVQILNEIYDGLLFFWKQLLLTSNFKGTGAVGQQLERARLELYDLQRTHGNVETTERDTIGWGTIAGTEDSDANA